MPTVNGPGHFNADCAKEEIHKFNLRRSIAKFCLWFVILTLYLNVGWAVVNYYDNYVFCKKPVTSWQKLWKGNFGLFNKPTSICPPNRVPADKTISSVFWPVPPVISLIDWTIYISWNILLAVWHGLVYVFWIVSQGGLAKLLGYV